MDQLNFISDDAPTTSEPLGQIAIRVVVFAKTLERAPVETAEVLIDEDDELADSDEEIGSYLETSNRGKQHVVFLLSGQRHHTLDRGFIVNDLGKKYISKRTLIVVELEGLTREAKSQLIQGSRSGFYEAGVFERLRSRIVALLKKDPDLERLEEEAEEELSQLRASDEAVNKALDELIEDHNPYADRSTEGKDVSGSGENKVLSNAGSSRKMEVVVNSTDGLVATGPVLVGRNLPKTLRIRPNQSKEFILSSEPATAWANLGKIGWIIDPPLEELKVTLEPAEDSARVSLLYASQSDDEEFPLDTKLLLFASFKGEDEPRLFEQMVVVKPATERVPRLAPVLLDEPSQIKLKTRKPIKLLIGDADRHVVFTWDGKDELVSGSTPTWKLKVHSSSHPAYPTPALALPIEGRFQAIISCPKDGSVYHPGTTVVFRAEAVGPSGKTLSIDFETIIEEPNLVIPEIGPRRLTTMLPFGSSRKPNYRVVEISEENYSAQDCPWSSAWTTTLAGAYIGPTEKAPLTLIINSDFEIFRSFIKAELAAKASAASIQRHQTKYFAHLCYYLYQMFLAQSTGGERSQNLGEDSSGPPTDDRNVQEINRVGRMLSRLMETMR